MLRFTCHPMLPMVLQLRLGLMQVTGFLFRFLIQELFNSGALLEL